jgi:hypothetical protein
MVVLVESTLDDGEFFAPHAAEALANFANTLRGANVCSGDRFDYGGARVTMVAITADGSEWKQRAQEALDKAEKLGHEASAMMLRNSSLVDSKSRLVASLARAEEQIAKQGAALKAAEDALERVRLAAKPFPTPYEINKIPTLAEMEQALRTRQQREDEKNKRMAEQMRNVAQQENPNIGPTIAEMARAKVRMDAEPPCGVPGCDVHVGPAFLHIHTP